MEPYPKQTPQTEGIPSDTPRPLGTNPLNEQYSPRGPEENPGNSSESWVNYVVDSARLSLLGIRRRLVERRLRGAEDKPHKRDHSASVYKHAAEATLALSEPEREVRDPAPRPTTKLHRRAALRANLRHDEINKLHHHQNKWTYLYGDVIRDKDTLETELRNGHYTRAQKKAMRRAGRLHRKAAHESEELQEKLEKSAEGNDIPGRTIKAMGGRSESRVGRLAEKVDHLEAREDTIRSKRQPHPNPSQAAAESEQRRIRENIGRPRDEPAASPESPTEVTEGQPTPSPTPPTEPTPASLPVRPGSEAAQEEHSRLIIPGRAGGASPDQLPGGRNFR